MQQPPAGSVRGAPLALTILLSHFPKLEMLGSRYMDPMEGQLEAFWTRTCQASGSLSSWFPPSAAHSSLDGTVGE
jgi:hypothetical protein